MTSTTRKYEFTEDHRIVALRSFGNVKEGDIGGYIESEKNLSHEGNCWVYDNGRVYGNARVYENAEIRDNAEVCDDAEIYGNAVVRLDAQVFQKAKVYGNANVGGKASVAGESLICDGASVMRTAIIHGKTIVSGDTCVVGTVSNSNIAGLSWIDGEIRNCTISGRSTVREKSEVYNSVLINTRIIGAYIKASTIEGEVGDTASVTNSKISKNTTILENARVKHSQTEGTVRIEGNALVIYSLISGDELGGRIPKIAHEMKLIRAVISEPLISVNRSDGYTFTIFEGRKDDDEKTLEIRITAGCRNFSLAEAREHWQTTRVGTWLGEESLRILDYLEVTFKQSKAWKTGSRKMQFEKIKTRYATR